MTDLRFPLVCFDLDGTLVDDTVYIWKTLHEGIGTNASLRKKAHDDYFAGKITYSQWFESDLDLLKKAGATRARVDKLLDTLRPMAGARDLLNLLRDRGHKLAIISGSLDIVVDHIFPDFAFDQVLINRIEFDGAGNISGGVPTPYDLPGKAEGLRELCRLEGITTSQAAFIGDNVNDVWVADAAGYSIAFNCKSDELMEVCDVEVDVSDILKVAELLG